jgi:hypothetical protein
MKWFINGYCHRGNKNRGSISTSKQETKTIALRQGFGEHYEPFHRGLLDCYFLSKTVVPPRPNLFCVTRTDSINKSLSSNGTQRPTNKFEQV